jgi:carbon starvation protein
MLLMPAWAMTHQLFAGDPGVPRWWDGGNWMLVGIALATLALEAWMLVEAFLLFPKARGVIERNAIEPQPEPAQA